ncbi:MAG: DMT family transporter [Candidatus Hydrogenedentes bacterium]|nr:DMT family transporter [Candidatus Hydrogenedentota bacterium]
MKCSAESSARPLEHTPILLFLGLVGINLLWAGNPVMTKFILRDFAPIQAAWLRIAVSVLVLAPIVLVRHRPKLTHASRFPWAEAVIAGAIVYFVTPIVVTVGLDRSLAVHNSFITGLEPVITIVLAWLVLHERMRASRWLVLGVAFSGFMLLSGMANTWLGLVASGHLLGNLLLLAGMVGESMFSIMGGRLVQRARPGVILLTCLLTGSVLLTAYLITTDAWPDFRNFSWSSAIGLAWAGPVTTVACYYFWLASLRVIPVNAAAFSLFVQPLVGAAMGYVLLTERMDAIQIAGAGLILLALALHVYLITHPYRRAAFARSSGTGPSRN